MHKYIPRLHIIQAVNPSNNDTKLSMAPFDNVNIFVFPETQFIAVTAYQSEHVTISIFLFQWSVLSFIRISGHTIENRSQSSEFFLYGKIDHCLCSS